MKKSFLCAFIVLAGCTPKVETYCNSFGVAANSSEYPACATYYNKMESWFTADLKACQGRAAQSFPDYMYDHPRYAQTEIIDRYGRIRESDTVIEPDYSRNVSLDIERRKIIIPCMAQYGWQSPDSWQAGRIGANLQKPQF